MRTEAARPFGQDFEKNLLLALGYAARIYPTVWDGLATDQPDWLSPHSGRGVRLLEGERLGA